MHIWTGIVSIKLDIDDNEGDENHETVIINLLIEVPDD
jgi:hypothetical protein